MGIKRGFLRLPYTDFFPSGKKSSVVLHGRLATASGELPIRASLEEECCQAVDGCHH